MLNIFKNIRPFTSYCLYDWANSPFSTVVITFVFASYFEKAIVGDPEKASIMWGWAISFSAILIAIFSPFIGRHIDKNFSHKFWLILFTFISSAGAALLWFAYPIESSVVFVLSILVISNLSFELGGVVYNSLIPNFAIKNKIGEISGKAWAAGYLGGIVCLVIILFGFIQTESPLFGIDKDNAANIRVAGPFVALWFILFSLPLFNNISNINSKVIQNKNSVFKDVIKSFKSIFAYNDVGKFLLARMVYTDGLNTLFAFGGLYASGTFNMSFSEIIIFGIMINITAGLGALFFSYLDDKVGPKLIILVSLFFLIIIGVFTLFITNKNLFLILGSALGFFIGSVQASSRSFMARFIKNGNNTEIFGFYAVSGKCTAFIGPAVISILIYFYDSQRIGMSSIIAFLVIGFLLMIYVSEPKKLMPKMSNTSKNH